MVALGFFATEGVRHFYTLSDRIEIIESQKLKIESLETRVYELRQIHDLMFILEQILTPMQIDELKALSEKIRQDKIRIHKQSYEPQ